MDAPHITINLPPPPAGAYWIGGVEYGLAFNLARRPKWWHRLMMRWAFGWVWVDAPHG
jgi:hypothetical protein